MDPVVEEMLRARDNVRPGFLRDWARYFDRVLTEKDQRIAELEEALTSPKKGKAA